MPAAPYKGQKFLTLLIERRRNEGRAKPLILKQNRVSKKNGSNLFLGLFRRQDAEKIEGEGRLLSIVGYYLKGSA
jgi:hypothetical protein